MKTKALLFVAALLVAGMIPAVAQSNPGSTNGTDFEMQLAWPDGTAYVSAIQKKDIDTKVSYGCNFYWYINWQETAGGNGEIRQCAYTNLYYWPGGRWPEFGGYYNGPAPVGPVPPYQGGVVMFGSYYFVSSDGTGTIQYNDQAQMMLMTGGEPGSTGSELYLISGGAYASCYEPAIGEWIGWDIPSQQIQIGSLGTLTTNGTLYAVLPTHQEVPVTPHVNGSKYYNAGVNAQGYQLVSQCVATTPTNQARTTIGVGEQVNLNFSPTLSVTYSNVVWSTTGGSLSYTNGTSDFFTAPSSATTVTITATVFGKPITKTFKVIEPTGIDHAQITGTNSYPLGAAGAGMTNTIWIAPTSVSFYRVSVLEIGEDATNIWGFFSQWTPQQLHHSTADKWTALNQANQFKDAANFGSYSSWGTGGGFTWNIPERWQVTGSGVTNSMTGCAQIFSIDVNGAASIDKYGNWIQRTTNNVITTN